MDSVDVKPGSNDADIPLVKARLDRTLYACVQDLQPLFYRDNGVPLQTIPSHVRAASGVRMWGRRLIVIQDDVSILAIQVDGQKFQPALIPTDPGNKSAIWNESENKKFKMDLEACLVLPDRRLVAFGSGSSPRRERIVVVNPSGEVHVREGSDLYAILRETAAFSGSELNIEGAIVLDDGIRLFQRCNGAPTALLKPVNATGDLPLEPFLRWLDRSGAAPHIGRIIQYDLGDVGGVRYGFTDAAIIPDGRIAFIACAEDSPDAVQDGAIIGVRFGIIDHEAIRVTGILDETGRPTKLKFEGLEYIVDGQDGSFFVVADMDNPDEPAFLGKLLVSGLFP